MVSETKACREQYITNAAYQPRLAKQTHTWYLAQLFIASAVHQPRSAKRKHIWRSCISTAITKLSESTAGRHNRDQGGISTAISKAKHTRRSCISTARHTNRNQQREITSGATVYQKRRTSTAFSTAEAYLAQLYINSHQKFKTKPFWTTQPYRPERYINRDQHQQTYLAQMYVTSAV